jgi:ParB family chromosome partitioning protein
MANKKQVLGRGLSAMLSSKETDTIKSSVNEINIDEISVNPFQPRSNFNNTSLQELSISIKNIGIIQPITVRKIENNNYQLISGERRLRACKELGLKNIPAYVREANDQDSLEMALVENIHRQDLDAIEIAISYQRLIEEINLTQEELSDKIGKNRTTISNYLRLLKLDPIIQSGIRDGFISMGHGRALINVNSNKDQLNIYKKIISKNLSVRNTELLVRDLKEKPSKATSKIKEKFKSSLLQTEVFINKGKNGKGNFVVNFDNEIEFERINKLLNDKQ